MKYEEKGCFNLNPENTNKNEIMDFNIDQQQTLKKRGWGAAGGEYSSGDAAAGEGCVHRSASNITQWVKALAVQAAQGEQLGAGGAQGWECE